MKILSVVLFLFTATTALPGKTKLKALHVTTTPSVENPHVSSFHFSSKVMKEVKRTSVNRARISPLSPSAGCSGHHHSNVNEPKRFVQQGQKLQSPSTCATVNTFNLNELVLKKVTIHTLFYGSFEQKVINIYKDFVSHLSQSNWYATQIKTYLKRPIDNYNDLVKNGTKIGKVAHLAQTKYGTDFSTSNDNDLVYGVLLQAIHDGLLPKPSTNNDTIYNLISDSTVSFSAKNGEFAQCKTYCGYHSYNIYKGNHFFYMFTPVNDHTKCNCLSQELSPLGLDTPDFDSMLSVLSHEIIETTSDPLTDNVRTAGGMENGDQCAWIFGARCSKTYFLDNLYYDSLGYDFSVEPNQKSFPPSAFINAKVGSKYYYLQGNFDNSLGYCVGDPTFYACGNDDMVMCHEEK